MKTSIEFLPEKKQEELKRIIEFLNAGKETDVEMLILFGSYARDTWVEHRYSENGTIYEYKSDYDLLVVLKDEKKARNRDLKTVVERKIREVLNTKTSVSLIFHGFNYLNRELRERNYFFIDIYNEGVLLYDSDKYYLECPPEKLPKDVRLMKARDYYEKWLKSADNFLRGFNFYYNNKDYPLAVFHLHQTAEHLFMAINLVFTDYKPKSHDLIDLHNRSIEFNEKFQEAFPCRTKEETDLFKKLNDAYIDSRYKKDYVISVSELDYMLERVKVLQKLAEELCREFILLFARNVADISDELMKKIQNTDASNEGFYEARERAEIEERKKIAGIEKNAKKENTKEITERIACDLLKNGAGVELVSKSTGLSVEEVEKLKR